MYTAKKRIFISFCCLSLCTQLTSVQSLVFVVVMYTTNKCIFISFCCLLLFSFLKRVVVLAQVVNVHC